MRHPPAKLSNGNQESFCQSAASVHEERPQTLGGGITRGKFQGISTESKEQAENSEVICQLSQWNEFVLTPATNILLHQELSLNL